MPPQRPSIGLPVSFVTRVGLARLALATLVVAAPPGAAAQQRDEAYTMTAERSRQVQTTLAAIEADKAAFVHQFLMSWTPYVDNATYDPFGELQAIALRAPAWQLYGASLVGDFTTMVRILRGEEGAGRYVNELTAPEARVATDPGWEVVEPDDFPTGTEDNLVYVPIAPCRIVDTRGSGARTGVIPANGSRSFDLKTAAFTSGQGVSGPCAGLPSFAHAAWAVNLTVTGYNGVGGLKAWGFGSPEPNASVINYAPGISAIANGLILTGCYGCADDITVKAFTAGTHVIIDVIGYFRQAEVTGSAVTRVFGSMTTIAALSGSDVVGGLCPAGTRLIGGELVHNGGVEKSVIGFGESSVNPARWTALVQNFESASVFSTVVSRCLDTPIRAVP